MRKNRTISLKKFRQANRNSAVLISAALIFPALFSFDPISKINDFRSTVIGQRSTVIGQRSNVISQRSTVIGHPSSFTGHPSSPANALYQSMSLDSLGLSREAFEEALTGFRNLQQNGAILNNSILSIIDFSLPSNKKRLFVLDLENGKVLFNTLVAHGRNSGQVLATRFSNRFRSFESSLGFYLTGETYTGHKGYSLRLLGMEQGINSNAYKRGIVVHAAAYVNEEISTVYGRVGRSEGCPAIPSDLHKPVIEAIKNGSCFFIYGKDKRYATRSKLLKGQPVS